MTLLARPTELRLGSVSSVADAATALNDVQLYLNQMGVLGFTLTLGGGLSGGSYDGSADVTAAVTSAPKVDHALTIGTHLTGGSYDGSASVTIATDATSSNTVSTIVARDGSGNFSAGTVTVNVLVTSGSVALNPMQLNGDSVGQGMQIKMGSTNVTSTFGSTYSGGYNFMAANAFQTTAATDSWTQAFAPARSLLYVQDYTLGHVWYNAAAGVSPATKATFWGSPLMALSPTGALTGLASLSAITLAGTLSTAAQPNVTSVGTLTGLGVSGGISTTGSLTFGGGAATLYNIISVTGTTTAAAYQRMSNTGADCIFGIEGSTGGILLTGSTAYAGVVTMVGNTPLQFGSNNTLAISMLGNAVTMPGTLAVTGQATVQSLLVSGGGGGGSAGSVWIAAVTGLTMRGVTGSGFDYAVYNPGGTNAVFAVPTGTVNVAFQGAVTVATTLAVTSDFSVNTSKFTASSSTGNTTCTGTVTTGAPSVNGAGAWNLGVGISGIALALKTTEYVEISIGGVVKKLAEVV